MDRSVLTIATGKQLYVDMAINLARSFYWWHPGTDISFILVTDMDIDLPIDLKGNLKLKKINPGDVGSGFSSKLYMDRLAPEGQTLFIDSDCLIFDKLDWIFERFKGHSVSVVGGYIATGEWFGDIEKICRDFNVPHIPKFNGGIYYVEKGKVATAVYNKARELEKSYDDIGFVRLRNKPNDEVLVALSMQLHNQTPIGEEEKIMGDPVVHPGMYAINVITGNRYLTSEPLPDGTVEKISPVVVHFLGYFTEYYPYRANAYRLKKAFSNTPQWLTELITLLTIQMPGGVKTTLKDKLRPLYHSIVGYRKIKPSERIIE
jgi:hypothetical protein